jgi:hypothetical protein
MPASGAGREAQGEAQVPKLAILDRSSLLTGAMLAGLLYGAASLSPATSAETAPVPNFAPDSLTGWQVPDDEFIPPPSGPGPIRSDPAHPYISFYKNPRNPHPGFRIADLTNPILQPWTREALRKANERAASGKYASIPKERCWPVGVPAFLLLPATPVYFVQAPRQVNLIWMQDHQVRRIYLDVPHSAKVTPSWFGESVGYYESGALVVDTVGVTTRTFVDNYLTPHTDALHVTERFRLTNDDKTLEVNVHVEDPGAFTTPWDAIQRYRRVSAPFAEIACAENNGDHFHQNLEPMPVADRPDF